MGTMRGIRLRHRADPSADSTGHKLPKRLGLDRDAERAHDALPVAGRANLGREVFS